MHMLWTECWCSPKFHRLKSNPQCDVGGGVLGRNLGPEGGALMNGMSILTKKPESSGHSFLPLCEDTTRSQQSTAQKRLLSRT